MRILVPARARRIASLASWTVVDQILSALSNILLAILVARSVDAEGFGAFATAVLVFSLAVGLTRAAIGQPLQITFAASPRAEYLGAVRAALGSALLAGTVSGLLVVAAGLLLGADSGAALVALGICLPALLVQDICRMAFFSSGRPRDAAAIDALWAIIVFGALAVILAAGVSSTWLPIAIWGAGAGISAICGFALLRCLPMVSGATGWAWNQRKLTGYLTAEFLLGQGIGVVGIVMIGVLGSQSGVGAVRAGQVLIGPLTILGAAAFMFAVPEVARRPSMSRRTREIFSVAVATAMGAIAAVYGAMLLLIPDSLGEQMFGDTWAGAQDVLLAMCLLAITAAIATGPVAILYGMGLSRVTFFVNIVRAPILIVLMTTGIVVWGAVGAAWALAITETILLPVWFFRLRKVLRSTSATAPAPEGSPSSAEVGSFPPDEPGSPLLQPLSAEPAMSLDPMGEATAGWASRPTRGRHAR